MAATSLGVTVAPASFLMLILGSECVLRYSTVVPLKTLGLTLAAGGIVLQGASRWSHSGVWWKALCIVGFCAYSLQAAYRFPGLLKEPQPYEALDLLSFAMRVLLLVGAATLAVGGIRFLVLRLRRNQT